jgi:hypothetical protein
MTDPDRTPTSTRVPLGSTKPRRERSNMSTQSSQSGASSGEQRLENDAFGESPSIDGTGAVVRVPHLLAFLCSIACKRQFQCDGWHSLMAQQQMLVAVSLWSMHDCKFNKCCCSVCTCCFVVVVWCVVRFSRAVCGIGQSHHISARMCASRCYTQLLLTRALCVCVACVHLALNSTMPHPATLSHRPPPRRRTRDMHTACVVVHCVTGTTPATLARECEVPQ